VLTRDQALLATGVLLAILTEEEEEAAKHAFKTHTAKVATPAGTKYYHEPIGSLIVLKSHPHDLKEHEKLVYVGAKAYSVPAQSVVWVPSGVDPHNDAEVAASVKYVQLGPIGKDEKGVQQDGKLVILTPAGEYSAGGVSEMPASAISEWLQQSGHWHQLLAEQQKVPVLLQGKLASWVPSDWKLYQASNAGVVWAKTPAGDWHIIAPGGAQPGLAPADQAEAYLKGGYLKPYDAAGKLPEAAVPPSPEALAGLSGATVGIAKGVGGKGGPDAGTIPVTAEQIAKAIEILDNTQSTAVKQPLQKAGHPLWEMAYHDINKEMLAKYPGLKIPPGTKQKHVGQVKISVMHHLKEQLEQLTATQAQAAQAEQAAHEQAQHAQAAQEIAGHDIEIAGKTFTTEQVQHAIDAIEGSDHWKVLAILHNAGNPLAKGTWGAFSSWKLGYPAFGKDTKGAYVAWLKELLDEAQYKDVEDKLAAKQPVNAKELDDLIKEAAKQVNLIPSSHVLDNKFQAIAAVLIMSHSDGIVRRVVKTGGVFPEWVVQVGLPPSTAPAADNYWEANGTHLLTHWVNGSPHESSPGNTLILFQNGYASLKDKAEQAEASGLPKTPDQQITDLAKEVSKETHKPGTHDTSMRGRIAYGITQVNSGDAPFYVWQDPDALLNGWNIGVQYPHDTAWSMGYKPGRKVFKIEPWQTDKALPGAAVTELTPWSGSPGEEHSAATHLLSKQDILDILNGVYPEPGASGSPMDSSSMAALLGLPADVQDLIAQGIGVDTGTGTASWVKLLPGSGLLSHAQAQAKSIGNHSYITQAPAGMATPWVYGASPPTPEEKAAGWWDVTPMGGAVYHPPAKDLGFTEQPGWADLDHLISASTAPKFQQDALKTGEWGAQIAFLLRYTATHKNQPNARYFRLKDGKPLAATQSPPAIGKSGHPQAPFFKIGSDHSVRSYNEQGDYTDYTPAEIMQIVSDHLHPGQEKPGPGPSPEQAGQPPNQAQATGLLSDWPNGSRLFQLTKDATTVAKKGQFYVRTPEGSWYWLKFGDAKEPVGDEGQHENMQHPEWVEDGTLALVAQKGNITGAVSTFTGGVAPALESKAGDEIPGFAQAALEKGEPITGIDPKTMPWAAKLPGGDSSALNSATLNTYGKTLYVTYSPVSEGHKWMYNEQGPEGVYGNADQSQGHWEVTPEKIISYHPPAAEVSDSDILDMANAHKPFGAGSTSDLAPKLAKAISLSMEAVGGGNTRYVRKNSFGEWVQNFTKPTTVTEWYQVQGGKVSHVTDGGATIHALSNADVAHIFNGGTPEVPQAKAPAEASPGVPTPPAAVQQALSEIHGSTLWYLPGHEAPNDYTFKWYAEDPLGGWHVISESSGHHQPVGGSSGKPNTATLDALIPASAMPKPAAPKKPEGPPIPVVYDNSSLVGEVPAGSVFYNYPGGQDSKSIYIKLPDGGWMIANSKTSLNDAGAHLITKYEGWLVAGKLKEIDAPSPGLVEQIKEAGELKAVLRNGAVDPDIAPANDDSEALGYWIATALSDNAGSDVYVWQNEDGSWKTSRGGPSGEASTDYYSINSGTLTGSHHEPGSVTPLTAEAVKAAIQKWVTPNAVKSSTAAGSKLFKFGHYYKGSGQTHLEISAKGYWNPYNGFWKKAQFIWHPASGPAKQMTFTAAYKWLHSGNPEHFTLEKGVGQAPAGLNLPSYATLFKVGVGPDPGLYQVWANDGVLGSLGVHGDGSALWTASNGHTATWAAPQTEAELGKGNILDAYGTTVVNPGVQPSKYRLFGGNETYSQGDLKKLLTLIEQDTSGAVTPQGWLGITNDSPAYPRLIQFFSDSGANGPQQQKDAIKGLLHELIEVPQYQASKSTAPAEIKYLKGLPPGIKGPADIFTQDAKGYTKPPKWPGASPDAPVNFYTLDASTLTALIKEYSQEFGGGKIIGTHPSALNKDEKAQWLDALKLGDMVTVFNFDAQGGKVSPAHPGAPANEATHQIIWGPWGAGETPAQMDVPGDWTSLEVVIPKAEVANYILAAGLQHAEFLTDAERRSWVTWHRKHIQSQVDAISQQAHLRWNAGANTLSEVPVFTPDVHPAKAYDVPLEDKTPASSWSLQAISAFVSDHKDDPDLKAAWETWKDNVGSSYSYDHIIGPDAGSSNKRSVVQQYLDTLKAKEEAEAAKPKYHTEADPDNYGNPPWSRVVDQYGWAGWWNSGDEKFRQHALAVAQLARMWGYRTPETRAAELDGEQGIAHNIPANSEGFDAVADLGKLTERQVQDIAREHVLNWALDNPTSVPGTYYAMPDGSIVGGMKTDALMGTLGSWKGLDITGQADLPAGQLSSQLYDAIMNHQVSRALADKAYIAAMRAASRISKTKDERIASTLAPWQAVKPGALDLAGIQERIHGLPADFQKLWENVYVKAGWKLPPVPKEQLRFGTHSGFSEEGFFDHVMASKSYGASAFFANPDMQHSGFLVWTELAGKGKDSPRLIRGETALLRNALAEFTQWAQQHQTGDTTNIQAPVITGPPLPANRATYYKGVINAAKAVSRHAADQNWEGDWTKKQLDWMEKHKAALDDELKQAEAAIAKGPESKEYAAVKDKLGQPEYVASAAKHYLDLFAKVEEAKANAGTFKPGDLPDWDKSLAPPLPEPKAEKGKPKPEIKVIVEKKSVVRELGNIDSEDGELKLGAGGTFDYPGYAWHITLPTGEVIEFQDTDATGTKAAHTGRIRFKADATKGSASLENIRAFLESAGIPMPEADDQYMELRYWRSMAGHLARHKDWNKASSYRKVWAEAAKQFGLPVPQSYSQAGKMVGKIADLNLDPADEAEKWRAAWATLTSPEQVAQFVEAGGYLPYFKHWDLRHPDAPNGHPIWMRFDLFPDTKLQGADSVKWMHGQPLQHSYHNGIEDGTKIALSGGAMSTESRLRVLGQWIGGMSSKTDMVSHGSSGVLYLRGAGYGHTSGNIALSPRLLAQTSTRAYDWDAYGDVDAAPQDDAHGSPFDLVSAASFTPTNETDVEDGASLLDDIMMIEAGNKAPAVIAALKAHGITEIRGLPVEQRVVTSMNASNSAVVRKHEADNLFRWFSRPEQVWEPPPSGVVTHAAIETEAEIKGKSSDVGALADQLAGEHASAEVPEDAATEADVSMMFYGSPAKPSDVMSKAPKVKFALAKRLADEMDSTDADIEALDQAVGLTYEQDWGSNDRERAIAGLIKTWAQTNSSPIIVALQHEAAKLFGLSKEQLEALPGGYAPQTAAAKELEDKFGPVLRDFLRAQWQLTQNDLEEAGIEDVTLYRIFKWNTPADWAQDLKPGDVIDSPPQYAIASWGYLQSAGAEIAGTYGSGQHSIVVQATFPRQALLSYPKTGFGSYNETEFTALDVPGQWKVVKVK
jgi:hypothetical protein